MRRTALLRLLPLIAPALLALSPCAPPAWAAPTPESTPTPEAVPTPEPGFVEEIVTVTAFGKLPVYRPDPVEKTRGVVIFVSGDGGWKQGVVDMARRSAGEALVVGISMPAWRKMAQKAKGTCWFAAGEIESVAQEIEKRYALPRYLRPILAGYSSGATLVYGMLAQAPAETFAGAVSLGFCPDLDVARPFCAHGDWKPTYDARKKFSLLPPRGDIAARPDGSPRWFVLQGQADQVCDPPRVASFASKVPGARLVPLGKVGHGFSVTRNWGEAYDEAIASLLEPVSAWEPLPEEARHVVQNYSPAEVRDRLEGLDLPLEVQWPDDAAEALIFVSGDGGWAELDQRVADGLADRGVAVVGWNALRYFWQAKTPEAFRDDLARVIAALPKGVRVYAGGYSFGAEVLPVILADGAAARPPLSRLGGLVLLAPGPYASFEISPLDWFRSDEPKTKHPVRKAIEALHEVPLLCLEPSDHGGSGCPPDEAPGSTRVKLPGGHHFAGDYDALVEQIFEFLKRTGSPAVAGD